MNHYAQFSGQLYACSRQRAYCFDCGALNRPWLKKSLMLTHLPDNSIKPGFNVTCCITPGRCADTCSLLNMCSAGINIMLIKHC